MFSLSLSTTIRQSLSAISSATSAFYTAIQSQLFSSSQTQTSPLSSSSFLSPSFPRPDPLLHPITPHYHAPRYPIVLCHGLFGFDKFGPTTLPALQVHYWSGVTETLSRLGVTFFVTKVPATSGIADRARALDQMLNESMKGKEVNLVGHSMGGLDGRYLASKICDDGRGDNYIVKSVTTLGTPHRGSPVMDWFRDWVGVGKWEAAGTDINNTTTAAIATTVTATAIKTATVTATATTSNISPSLDSSASKKSFFTFDFPTPSLSFDPVIKALVSRLDTPAYSNLTTSYATEHFNPSTPDAPSVHYFSYGASMSNGIPLYSPLGLPWQIVNAAEGANDGLVSIRSARWGSYLGTVEADHWALNGRGKSWSGGAKFDVGGFFAEMCGRLWREGF